MALPKAATEKRVATFEVGFINLISDVCYDVSAIVAQVDLRSQSWVQELTHFSLSITEPERQLNSSKETTLATCLLWLFCMGCVTSPLFGADRLPNVVLIMTDDQGYGDVGCYGASDFRTPNMDSLAKDGVRFTSFYVSQPVCTASRASLLTGCYANRVGFAGALNPTSLNGIHEREILMSELLKERGYATAIFGKWHLGYPSRFNPLNHGFDEYFGLPFSNDNSNDYHPIIRTFPPLPLFDGHKIVARDPDQSLFTRQFTERAVKFIDANQDAPFFLYVPHVMPHVPIFSSKDFEGRSGSGRYGDVIEELDWSVGEILKTIRKHGLDDNTLVIFMSDNGPWLSYGEHAGSSGSLRGGKLTTFEGGVRVPCMMRWPGRIPSGGVCDELVTSMDLLPTISGLVAGKLPKHKIDGKDIWPLINGSSDESPHEAFYYYAGGDLHAVRSGDWKLHFAHPFLEVAGEPGKGGKPANFENLTPNAITESGLKGIASRHGYRIKHTELELYNLRDDLSETNNVIKQHEDVVKRLVALAEGARADLGDKLTDRVGVKLRPSGVVEKLDIDN